jgi:hypothetical protein
MGGHKKGLTPVMKNAMVISHRHDLCPSQKIPRTLIFPKFVRQKKGLFVHQEKRQLICCRKRLNLFLLGSFGFTLTVNRHRKLLNKNPFTYYGRKSEDFSNICLFVWGQHFGKTTLGGMAFRYSASRTEDRGFESPPGCKEVLNCNSVIS